ncbi:MAG: protein-L-isoaspartate(D-aspartate) O-methyltransferase [Pseudomonadota bacterium]
MARHVADSIQHRRTISQPYVVASMTEALLRDGPLNKVLEVGTGCGYQTAVLAPLVNMIYSIERIKPLADRARMLLREMGIRNVRLSHGDGWEGLPRFQPFDGILVAAAPQEIPQALLGQLAQGGRMVIPVGPSRDQELVLLTRKGDTFEREVLENVRFVPLLEGLQ